jgi:carboxymethylenebutenolidase
LPDHCRSGDTFSKQEDTQVPNDEKDRERSDAVLSDWSRRDFVALSAATGLAAATGSLSAAQSKLVEEDVEIKMPDGVCDAAFIHPATGSHPGVLIWTDAFGLRPAFRDFGRRVAADGYSVLVPNPFYRTAKAPVYGDVSMVDFQNEATRATMKQFMDPLTAAGAAEADAKSYIAFLNVHKSVNRSKKIGIQGYCMGGPLVMRTAATLPDLIGAGATFHGGGLVTDKPDSPHLLAPRIKARLYIAIAANDDMRQPDAKDKLRDAFAAAKVTAEIEVYPGTKHGWCVPDMPMQNGEPIYSQPDAERAWSKLMALYKASLA